MIYYDTEITVPCNIAKVSNEYKLLVINTVTNKEYSIDVVDSSSSEFFYTFDVASLKLDNGTYQYYVSNGDENLASGLIQVGKIKKGKTVYDNVPKYKVYEG